MGKSVKANGSTASQKPNPNPLLPFTNHPRTPESPQPSHASSGSILSRARPPSSPFFGGSQNKHYHQRSAPASKHGGKHLEPSGFSTAENLQQAQTTFADNPSPPLSPSSFPNPPLRPFDFSKRPVPPRPTFFTTQGERKLRVPKKLVKRDDSWLGKASNILQNPASREEAPTTGTNLTQALAEAVDDNLDWLVDQAEHTKLTPSPLRLRKPSTPIAPAEDSPKTVLPKESYVRTQVSQSKAAHTHPAPSAPLDEDDEELPPQTFYEFVRKFRRRQRNHETASSASDTDGTDTTERRNKHRKKALENLLSSPLSDEEFAEYNFPRRSIPEPPKSGRRTPELTSGESSTPKNKMDTLHPDSAAAMTAHRREAIRLAKTQEAVVAEKCKRNNQDVPGYSFDELIGKGSFGRVYKG